MNLVTGHHCYCKPVGVTILATGMLKSTASFFMKAILVNYG